MTLFLCSLPLAAQVAPAPGAQPPDLRPENAVARIKARNLFHPTRGILPQATDPLAQVPPPVLKGTVLSRTARGAILAWGGDAEGQLLQEKGECKGFRLLKVEPGRAQLELLRSGEKLWVGLEQLSPADESQREDYEQLLSGKPLPGEAKGAKPGPTEGRPLSPESPK